MSESLQESLISNDSHNEIYFGSYIAFNKDEQETHIYEEFFEGHKNKDLIIINKFSIKQWTESGLAVGITFSILFKNQTSFENLRSNNRLLLISICGFLRMKYENFTYAYFSNQPKEFSIILEFALCEILSRNLCEIAKFIIENSQNIKITRRIIENILKNSNLDLIDLLLNKNVNFAYENEVNKMDTKILDCLDIAEFLLAMSTDNIVIKFIKKHKIKLDDKLLELISTNGRFSILNKLNEYYVPNNETFLNAIWHNAFEYLLSNRQYFVDYMNSKGAEELLNALVKSCENFDYIEVKIYLLSITKEHYSQKHANIIFQIFDSAISEEKLVQNSNIFSYTHNPIKISVLIIELLKYFGEKYRILQTYFKKIRIGLMKIIELNMEKINNFNEMRILLLEQDLQGREILILIEQLKLYEILKNEKMPLVVDSIWSTKYTVAESFFDGNSNLYKLLWNWPINTKIDLEHILSNENKKNENLLPLNISFNIWKKGIEIRYIAQSVVYFIFAILTQIVVYLYLIDGAAYYNSENNKVDLAIIKDFNYDFKVFMRFAVVWFVFPVKVLFEALFKWRAKRTYRIFNMDFFILLIQLLCICAIYIEENRITKICERLLKNKENYNDYEYYFDENDNKNDKLYTSHLVCFYNTFWSGYYESQKWVFIKEIIGVFMLCVWAHALMSLNVSKLLGPTATNILYFMRDLARFFSLYGLVLIIAGCFFGLLLIQNDEFKNIFKSFYTVTMVSLLFFEPDLVDKGDARTRFYGAFFMLVYMYFAFMIIMLLLGVFWVSYEKAESREKVLILSKSIELRQKYKYDKKYSYYVSVPFPLAAFLLPTVPLAILGIDSPIINDIMLNAEYIPLMMVFVIVFFIANLLMLPFVFIKTTIIKFWFIFRKVNKNDKIYTKIFTFLKFVFIGIFALLYKIIKDTIKIVKRLYSTEKNQIIENNEFKISQIDLKTLRQFIRYLYKLKNEVGNSNMQITEIFQKFKSYIQLKHIQEINFAALEPIKLIFKTLEFDSKSQKVVNIRICYALLYSIQHLPSQNLLAQDIKIKGNYEKIKKGILKNFNRRIICFNKEENENKENIEEDKNIDI